ncbi:MAG: hypothetical protein KAS32_03380 [Candidatus Peribacteraceae bacterium]|nr:hypothetical protein [Candidatus Peribacteraceae bacterium]
MINMLNLGAGKLVKADLEALGWKFDKWDTLVQLDTLFKNIPDVAVDLSGAVHAMEHNPSIGTSLNTIRCYEDAFHFLENCPVKFDGIFSARFFEHIGWSSLMYFIYLVADSMKQGALLDIIVPNYKTLATRILNEKVDAPDFEKENIITTTELLNEPSMPHSSIWTPERAKYYLEYEGRFEVEKIDSTFSFEGRDVYMRVAARRV